MNRFTDNGDGTVTDNQTGLIWSRNADHGKMEWDRANHYCYRLDFAGYHDWRLPTAHELFSLVDLSELTPTLPKDHPFINVQSSYYWSSTTSADDTGYAWDMDFGYGSVGSSDKTVSYYVWPVRGGHRKE